MTAHASAPDQVTIAERDAALAATFCPKLGMVGCSLRHEGEELLYQGTGLAAYVARGSTFALPFLYPWANRLSAWTFALGASRVTLDEGSPIIHRDAATATAIHGLLAASPHWQVTEAGADSLTAELDFGAVPQYAAAFPFPHRVRYTATLAGARLSVTITVQATSDVAVPVSFGFHPYLTLPGSDRRDWRIELPVASRAPLDERMLPTGELVGLHPGELDGPLADRTFDTSFPELYGEQPAFVLADERRRVTLTHAGGYPVCQVYAPERSQFICFEPMTAPVNALISGDGLRWVQPGAHFDAVFTIDVANV
ncbi:MAG: aldose 1-epimerase [Solirubrobacteraceae bacterium]